MKLRKLTGKFGMLAAIFALALPLKQAMAQQTANANITAIFGSGNPNGGWAQDTNTNDDLQAALRFKINTPPGITTNTNGHYSAALGSDIKLEFSVDTDADGVTANGHNLDTFTYNWSLTSNLGNSSSFSPTLIGDNAYGTPSTANGGGTTGLYTSFDAGPDDIMQNSEDIHFPFLGGENTSLDQTLTATFDIFNSDHVIVDQVVITDKIGNGGPHGVPEGGSSAMLLGLGLLGLAAASARGRLLI